MKKKKKSLKKAAKPYLSKKRQKEYDSSPVYGHASMEFAYLDKYGVLDFAAVPVLAEPTIAEANPGEARESTPDEGGLRTSTHCGDTQSVSRGGSEICENCGRYWGICHGNCIFYDLPNYGFHK